MTSGKLTYAELLAEKKKLERRIEDTEAAMKAADRHMVRSSYHATEWIAIPLREQQREAVREYFEDRKRYDEREQFADFRRYTEIHECSVLPEFQHYLIRYETDNEGNDISSLKVWGLVPASLSFASDSVIRA